MPIESEPPSAPEPPSEIALPSKAELRAQIAARRTHMSVDVRNHAAQALAARIRANPFGWQSGSTVAAYVPVGTEPGSTEMLDALVDLGATVLLPVVPDGDPAPLTWVTYRGEQSLQRRRWGLLEPTGTPEGPQAILAASAILVPALAVSRTGIRLGRGAGYYDRSIHACTAELIGVVNDDELLDYVPGDEHDVPMRWALTPEAGFCALDG